MPELGKLERVANLRSQWQDEARDFTPWLAEQENLSLLAETLGYGVDGFDLEATEFSVGAFRADILCKDNNSADGARVLIENQFGTSDHDHLGKLITYASGLKANTIILIGEKIREEHRAALDWLNEISADDHRFFAVTVELWRIGASPLAPRFNVVVKPNDWVRAVEKRAASSARSDLGPTKTFNLEFWSTFIPYFGEAQSVIRPVSPQPSMWISHGIGKTNVGLNAVVVAQSNSLRVELYFSGPTAKQYFAEISQEKYEIEQECGLELEWINEDQKREAKVSISKVFDDVTAQESWRAQHEWLAEKMVAFHGVFHRRVRRLQPGIPESEE